MTRTDRTILRLGAPDWDYDKREDINDGDKVPADGWCVAFTGPTGSSVGPREVYVNDHICVSFGDRQGKENSAAWSFQQSVFPVSKGDKITFSGSDTVSCTFYPCK